MRRTICWIRGRIYFPNERLSSALLLTSQHHINLCLQASNITRTRLTTSLSNAERTKSTEINISHIEKELMIRAEPYGLTNIKDIHRESRLAPLDRVGTYLVDHPLHRFELPLWEILLDYQVFRHGPQSVQTIWHGLKYRGRSVVLTADDDSTTALWLKLLKAAVQSKDLYLLKLLCRRDGLARNRSRLFAEVIGTCLKYGTEDQALSMVAHLRPKILMKKTSILDFYNVLEPKDRTHLKYFINFSSYFPPEKVYGNLVPRLWDTTGYKDVILLHNFLIAKGDLPSSIEEIKPFLRYFAEYQQGPTRFLQHLKDSGASFVHQAHDFYKDAVAQIENSQPSKRRWISDSFAARLFATKTLSFDFVLNSLLLFGPVNIGPQSLREIGLSASDLETLSSRFSRLDELHIDTGSHAYSRLLRKLCSTKQETLLKAALETSMHHDVFEDIVLLQQLLLESFNKGNWKEVNLLLAILKNGEVVNTNIGARQQILDLLSFDERERLLLALCSDSVLEHDEQGVDLTQLALDCFSHIWTGERIKGKMVQSKLRRIKYLTGILQNSEAAGKNVPVGQWALALRLIRNFGSLSDIIGLSLWIAKRYLAPFGGAQYHSGVTIMLLLRPLRLLNATYQRLLVSKAFRIDISDGLSRTQWRNLNLVLKFLKYLEIKYDIRIDLRTIRRVLARDLRGHSIRSRSYRFLLGRPQPNIRPKVTLVNLMHMIHKMWATTDLVLEREVELAVESLKDKKKLNRRTLHEKAPSKKSSCTLIGQDTVWE